MKKKIVLTIGLAVIGLAAYLTLWPVPIEPVRWQAPSSPGYVGEHAPNTKLSELTIVPLEAGWGPEHILLGADNKLYAGVSGGRVLRMDPDASHQEIYAETGGRVLGLDFDGGGNLIVADALRGLLSIAADGKVTLLCDRAGGQPIGFADAVVVASDGRIFFSDATTRFPPSRWNREDATEYASALDILEHSSSGRVIEYDPADKTTRVLADGLSFANGLALSRDEQTLFVAETGEYRIWKIAVTASNLDLRKPTPQASIVIENLPGFPDNLTRGRDGKIWVGLFAPRVPILDEIADQPFWRKFTLRLPAAFRPESRKRGHVFAFNDDGQVVVDLQDPSGSFPKTTGATETADRLYLHTLNRQGLGWLDR